MTITRETRSKYNVKTHPIELTTSTR